MRTALSAFILMTCMEISGSQAVSQDQLCAAWELYLARNDRVNGEIKFKVLTDSKQEPDRDDVFMIAFDKDFGIAESHYRAASNRSEANGFTPNYLFTLDQDLSTKKWRVVEMQPPAASGPIRERVDRYLDMAKGTMFRLSYSGEQLVQDLRAKRFKIISIRESPDSRWLDVAIEATDFSVAKRRFTRSGTIRCANVAPYYLPKGCTLKCSWPDPDIKNGGTRDAVLDHEFNYEEESGLPRLIMAKRIRNVPGLAKHWKIQETMEFNLSNRSPPKERFYVSHYGLPEAFGVEAPKPTPWFLYSSLTAVGAIVLGALLIRRSRRVA